MARRTLDRSKPFGNIFGIDDDGAVFTQGMYKFDTDGNECGPGITPKVADPLRPGAAGPAQTEPTPVAVTPGVTAADLAELHPAQIKKLVEAEGLVAVSGPGSKKANIELLLSVAS